MNTFLKKSIITILMAIGIIAILAISGHAETHYSTTAVVYSTDDTGTIFIDGAGYLWETTDTNYNKNEIGLLWLK